MLYRFDDYVLDVDRRELRCDQAPVAIEPMVFDLLACLVSNRHRLVSKDDLLASVWGGRIVSESTLASRINAVRRVIGDSGEQQRLIRTSIGKGFRFVGEVQEHHPNGDVVIVPEKPSLAVLLFQNITGDAKQEYFVDGMVEEITTAIARMPWLFVIARDSAFTYKGKPVDVKHAGRELGVRYILDRMFVAGWWPAPR